MRVVIQRVSQASVTISNKVYAEIKQGYLLLVGIEEADLEEDIEWLAKKIINLRLFSDEAGLMNLSIEDVKGELLVISQFTLFAKTKKGNRPSFIHAAKPEKAIPIYDAFIRQLSLLCSNPIKTGEFGANMQVSLVNDGPVTLIIDSKNRV